MAGKITKVSPSGFPVLNGNVHPSLCRLCTANPTNSFARDEAARTGPRSVRDRTLDSIGGRFAHGRLQHEPACPLIFSDLGLAVGLPFAYRLNLVTASQLFGLNGLNWPMLAAFTVGILLVALLAAQVPARGAMRSEPDRRFAIRIIHFRGKSDPETHLDRGRHPPVEENSGRPQS